jgi:hypothetical protein
MKPLSATKRPHIDPTADERASSSAAKASVLAAEEERDDLLNFGISPAFLVSPLPGSHRLQASLATLFDGSAICAKKRQVTLDEWPNGGSLKPKCTSFVSYIPTDFMHATGYKSERPPKNYQALNVEQSAHEADHDGTIRTAVAHPV